MRYGPEWEVVERPLLEHLSSLGWETLVWSERQVTDNVARLSDRDVLLEQRLGSALLKINQGPDDLPWLDEVRINSAAAELRSMPAGAKLLEANRVSTDLLLGGLQSRGLRGGMVVGIGPLITSIGTTGGLMTFLRCRSSRLRHRVRRRTFGPM